MVKYFIVVLITNYTKYSHALYTIKYEAFNFHKDHVLVGHRGIHDSTAALSVFMTPPGSSLFTTALPDTIIFAPACVTIQSWCRDNTNK